MVSKKWCILLILLVMLPSAFGFSVTYTAINNSIFKDEAGSFALTVVNTKGFEDNFQISTRNPEWILSTDPLLSSVPELSTKSHVLYIKPKQSVSVGPHAVPVKIKSLQTGHFKEDNLLINIRPKTPFGGEYAPAVNLQVEVDSKVKVTDKFAVKVDMANKNPRDMQGLVMRVDGEVFSEEISLPISPLEKKKRDFLFEVPEHTSPGVYTLSVKLILQNITIGEVSKDFEVLPYSNIEESMIKDSSFFKSTKLYVLTNNGNLHEDAVLRKRVPFYKKIFVSFDPSPKKVKVDGKKFYEWRRPVVPGGNFEVTGVENYRILALLIFAIAIAVVVYYLFRSPVAVSKEAFTVNSSENRTTVKIKLEVRNRSKNLIKKVSLMDRVPNIADIEKKMPVGTLKPTKIVISKSKGSSMRWEIDVLEPYEERIITYMIHCKLRIVGGMNLPPAQAKFETEQGQERVSYSNTAGVIDREI